jgi:hypothetical protein
VGEAQKKGNRSQRAVLGTRLVRAAHGVRTCVWPTNCEHACRRPAQQGRTCAEHMMSIHDRIGTLDCAWPGCAWRVWDRKGLCSFHRRVAFGLVDS